MRDPKLKTTTTINTSKKIKKTFLETEEETTEINLNLKISFIIELKKLATRLDLDLRTRPEANKFALAHIVHRRVIPHLSLNLPKQERRQKYQGRSSL